uniref:Uncharacterized protein n=1 Tax=Rhizophora mucronata TaxID=61149 RepID=A0A2P2PLY0_RHIMU
MGRGFHLLKMLNAFIWQLPSSYVDLTRSFVPNIFI